MANKYPRKRPSYRGAVAYVAGNSLQATKKELELVRMVSDLWQVPGSEVAISVMQARARQAKARHVEGEGAANG